MWLATSFDEAIDLSETEAVEYARVVEADEDLGMAQCYWIGDDQDLPYTTPVGVEVFSLIRDVEMDADDYIRTYFQTGNEHQHSDDDS